MELLRIDRAAAAVLIAALIPILAGACHREEDWQREGTLFPHAAHVEQGLDCSDCHAGVLENDAPGLPPDMMCTLCHEGLDEEKDPQQRVANLLASGQLQPRHVTQLSDEVLFSHLRHVQAGLDCSACHGAVGDSDPLPPGVRVDMAECLDCHARSGLASDCASCHREIRSDRPPPSHRALWLEVHGETALARTEGANADCALCHQESSCSSCHLNEPPRSHTEFWRRRGHGQAAAFDRRTCATCHESDSCDRCHSEARPPSHGARWGGVRSEHCFSCHFPLRSEGCVACHQGTDAHFMAPPRPSTHFPGMDCRQCHGLTAPLPHADDGTDCTLCHS